MKIGIFDSGMGGLSVLHRALRMIPEADFLYYADEEHVPYGEKTREQVRGYIDEIIAFMIKKQVDAIVIACNTATSVATKEYRSQFPLPIVGMEPAVKKAVEDKADVKVKAEEAKQKRMNEALNQWIFTLPEEERQLFVETLFQVIDQTGVTTLTEFSEHWKENLKSCLKSLKSLDPETRKRIRRIIKILLEIYGNTLRGEKEK